MNGRLRGLGAAQLMVVLVAGLLPVVHSMLLHRYFRTPQLALLVVCIGGMPALVRRGTWQWLRSESLALRLSIGSFAAALAWMAVSATFGEDPLRSLMGHSYGSTGLLMWIAAFGLYLLALRYRSGLRAWLETATVAAWAALLAFVGMWLISPDLVQEFLVPLSGEGVPLPGVGQSAFLAAFAGAGLMVVLGRWMGGRRTLATAAMALTLSAYLAVTQARVPIVLAGASVVAGFFRMRRTAQTASKATAALVLAVIASAVLSHVLLVPRLNPPGEEAKPVESHVVADPRGRFAPSQLTSGVRFRTTVWDVAAKAVSRDPLFGTGPANFTYAYRELATASHFATVGEPPDTEIQDAHNIFLELAATSGVPAALFVLGGMAALGWSIRRFGTDRIIWVRLAAVQLLGVLIVEPLSLVIVPLLAIFGGVSAGGTEPALGTPASPRLPAKIGGITAVAVSILIAGSLLWSDRLLARGSTEWDRRALQLAVRLDPTCQPCLYELGKVRSWDFKKSGIGTETWALQPFRRAVQLRPRDSESHLRLGRGLIFLGRPVLAVEPLLQAKRLDPYSPTISVALAGAYLNSGNLEEALVRAREAVRIQPSSVAYEIIATAAERSGDFELRDKALAEAKALAPSD